MTRRLIFAPSIPGDLRAALDYYDQLSPKLANQFRLNVDKRLDDIAARPESFSIDVDPVRFARIDRFPYVIFFVVQPEFVSIIAVLHGASNPTKWRNRRNESTGE